MGHAAITLTSVRQGADALLAALSGPAGLFGEAVFGEAEGAG
ncbi:hypothetical protein [Streptosporangium saharense]